MSRTFALRFVFAVLLLAVLACNPLSSLPNPAGLAGTAVSGIAGTQGASLAQTAAAAVAGGLGPTPSFTPQPTPDWPADTYLPAELDRGTLKLDSVAANGDGSNFYGPLMLLQVTNPGTNDVLTTIPCGLIFQPDDTEQQRLMVIQAYSATVQAGRQADLKPYIVCIDSSKHAPAEHATYTIGNMASGDLLALAACVCTQPLTFEKDIPRELGLQFAVWHTSDPEFPGNAGDSPLGSAIEPFIKVGTDIANGWLKSCGLKTMP